MMELELLAKMLLGAAVVVCLWFIVRGMIEMQRINASAEDVLELQGVVRQVTPLVNGDCQAVLTLNVDEDVLHVDCVLPGPWLAGRRHQVTDIVPVLWRRGDRRAVALQTIRDGQRMFLIGFVSLAAAALIYVLLF